MPLYLQDFPLPEHYVLFLVAGALVVALLFPMFRLYEPQRGVSIIEEVRSLVLAWLLVTGLIGGAIFATKTGDSFSRVWVTLWLAGGFRCDRRLARVGASGPADAAAPRP